MPTYDPRRRPERWARSRSGHARARFTSCASLLLVLAAGCDFPTSLPKWDTTWLVPVKSATGTVSQLLPASVSTTPDGSAFLVSVAPVTISRTLGELCSACNALNGQTVAKPAFTATVSDTLRLPSGVTGATLDVGTIPATITNGFGFDPIRPSATARGSLQLTLPSGGSNAGGLTMDGATDSLPAGWSGTRSLFLVGGVDITDKTPAVLTINSPAGGTVHIDTNQRFAMSSPTGIRVTAVKVDVNGKMLSIPPVELSLGDIDPSLVDRVRAGALVLTIDNMSSVTGTLTMTISAPGVTIQKPIQLEAFYTPAQRVPFTEDEIRSILGRSGVTVTASGSVSSDQPVTIIPSATVQVNAQLELTLGSTAGAADIAPLH